jgi:hypothetical protein
MAVVTGLLCIAPFVNNGFRYGFWQNAANVAGLVVLGGLVSAAALYGRHVSERIRSQKLTDGDLGIAELVLKQTPFGFVHHRTGRAWRFWDAVGGKLYLTSSRLLFRAHPGQFWRYELVIPLAEVAKVQPCRVICVPRGLTVVRTDGTKELFACGPLEDLDEWVSAVEVVRAVGPMVEGRRDEAPPAEEDGGMQQTPRESD